MAVFDRAGDGTLTQKPGPAGCISDSGAGRCRDGTALDSSHSVAVSPDGQSVYVASASSDAVAVFDRAPNGRLAATNPRAVRGGREAGGEGSAAAAAAASVR